MKRIIFSLFFLLIVAGYIFYLGLNEFRDQATSSAGRISYGFEQAKNALFALEPHQAIDRFSDIKNEIALLQSQLPALTGFIPLLKNVPSLFTQITDLTHSATIISKYTETLQKNGVHYIINKQGKELLVLLNNLKNEAKKMRDLSRNLTQSAANLAIHLEDQLNASVVQIQKSIDFLEVMISWLDAPQPRHILIMFYNPSEMRPGGGFLGSFALATLYRGNLTNLEVHDIYDFDGQLTKKIIPPTPLQTITTNWGARDANWFFDFPTSARKTFELLEASKIFEERGIEFSAGIALNSTVVQDLLRTVGPITLPSSSSTSTSPTVVSANTILQEIQRTVEKTKSKSIISDITPLLFEKLGSLTEDQKNTLVSTMRDRIISKDIMVYFNDVIMESYVENASIGGEIADLPRPYHGDYLAIVNANIAGGKSDAFITQHTNLHSRVDVSGLVINTLTVSRTHNGKDERDAWYRVDNQNFIQILTPSDTMSAILSGGFDKTIHAPIDYERLGYRHDTDLTSISNDDYFGKHAHSTWLSTRAGTTDQLTLAYTLPHRFDLSNNNSNRSYTFIFDKQSGVVGDFAYSIEAPEEYTWRQKNILDSRGNGGGPVFVYRVKNPPARITIDLELVRGSSK